MPRRNKTNSERRAIKRYGKNGNKIRIASKKSHKSPKEEYDK